MKEGKRGTRLREPASTTTEGEEILMVTIGTAYPGKTLIKITTFQVLPDYVRNYWAKEAIFTREEIVVPVLELIKVMIEQLPQRRLPRFSAPIYFRVVA
jgi:hypothetical protein